MDEIASLFRMFKSNDSFATFDKDKLVRLAQFYPKDFSPTELMQLKT